MLEQVKHILNEIGVNNAGYKIIYLAALPVVQPGNLLQAPRSQGMQSLLECERMIDQFEHCLNETEANNASYKIIHLAALPVLHLGHLLQAPGSQGRATTLGVGINLNTA